MTDWGSDIFRCRVRECPWPDDEDMHHCWAFGESWHDCGGGWTHAHIPRKGMGGNNPNSKIRAMWCWPLHDAIDNGFPHKGRRLANDAIEIDGVWFVRVWERDPSDMKALLPEPLFERAVPESEVPA